MEDNEGGEVLVQAAESVGKPRTHRRLTGHHVAGIRKHIGRLVVDGLRVHRLDDANVVRHLGRVGQDIRNPGAAFPVLLEANRRRGDGETGLARGHARNALAIADGWREVLVKALLELGLRVEHLELRRRANHREVDAALRLGREVLGAGQASGLGLAGKGLAQERPEGNAPEAHGVLAEELSTV